jgi:hypothetical protein
VGAHVVHGKDSNSNSNKHGMNMALPTLNQGTEQKKAKRKRHGTG